MAREINLVPDIKNEMIKSLKLRNFIFFISLIVAAGSVGVTLFFGGIMGGQQLALTSKQSTLENLSKKINSYEDLSEFLTFQGQISSIDTIVSQKQVLSRTFNILSALIPTGADTITISELSVKLGDSPSFTFSAHADAGQEPYIDYNVLDSFKKSMQYMRYDYGNYVDKDGNSIPAYCIIENDANGSIFTDAEKGVYAYWDYTTEGCSSVATDEDDNNDDYDEDDDEKTTENENTTKDENTEENNISENIVSFPGYTTEQYGDKSVVRIWRTPQYADWYKETEKENEPYMSLSGEIKNVAHFESSCITYTGVLVNNETTPKWSETNDSCYLVPNGTDGIKISGSSNARRESDNELVLNFEATIYLNPDVFSFSKKHVLAIAPSGRHNVTDSYVQIQAMFGERATECEDDDTLCQSDTTNEKGEN